MIIYTDTKKKDGEKKYGRKKPEGTTKRPEKKKKIGKITTKTTTGRRVHYRNGENVRNGARPTTIFSYRIIRRARFHGNNIEILRPFYI